MKCCFPCFGSTNQTKSPTNGDSRTQVKHGPPNLVLITEQTESTILICNDVDLSNNQDTKTEMKTVNSEESLFHFQEYKPEIPYKLMFSLPPGSGPLPAKPSSTSYHVHNNRKIMKIDMPNTKMPCYCSALPEITRLDTTNTHHISKFKLHSKLPGCTRQHVHQATVAFNGNEEKLQNIIIKITYSEVEYHNVRFLHRQKYFDSDPPLMPLIASYKWLPTSCSVPVYFLLFQKGPTDLFDYLKRRTYSPTTIAETTLIVFRTLIQLSKLHDLNMAHLDVSIENILHDPVTNNTKLIDFEVSQYLNPNDKFHFNINKENPENNHLSDIYKQGNIACFGKTQCMSYEQAAYKPVHAFQTDVFTIGIMAFETFFTGPPYTSPKDADANMFFKPNQMNKIVKLYYPNRYQEFISNPNLESFIFQCCQLDLDKRPRHARTLLQHPLFQHFISDHKLKSYIEDKTNAFPQTYQETLIVD